VTETGIEETLDKFYGWGQLLLADFDDIDKNADSERLSEIRNEISELLESTSEQQRNGGMI